MFMNNMDFVYFYPNKLQLELRDGARPCHHNDRRVAATGFQI